MRYTGLLVAAALGMKYGSMQPEIKLMLHPIVEFYSAVLGTMDLMGKDILVRLKSPLIIFLPISLIISLPIDLIFLTCYLSSQYLPPSE